MLIRSGFSRLFSPAAVVRGLLPTLAVALLLLPAGAQATAGCQAANPQANIPEDTPTADFSLSGATVSHSSTGLMWDRCPLGMSWDSNTSSCTGTAGSYTWQQALQASVAANANNHLGYSDWRVPNRRELNSIIERCGHSPAINQEVFPDTPGTGGGSAEFWSASSYVPLPPAQAWIVIFNYGHLYSKDKGGGGRVRLVRNGQPIESFDRLKVTATSLVSSDNLSVYGNPITLTATVTGTLPASPTGGVSFYLSGAVLNCDGGNQNLDGSGQATCVLNSLVVGTYAFTAKYAGDSNNYVSESGVLSQVVNKADQTITGLASNPSSGVMNGTAALSVTGSGGSGNPVLYGSMGSCTVSGNNVSFLAAGTCTVTAYQAGNANYNPTPQVNLDITVAKANQTITGFASSPGSGVMNGSATLSVSGSGGSGNPVTYASTTTGVCTVSGNTVSFVAAGSCTVSADQTGDANYNTAPQVSLAIPVVKANQTITFPPLPDKIYGDADFSVSAISDSGLNVAFSSQTGTVCTVSGNTVSLIGGGNCTLRASQTGDGNYNPASDVDQSFDVLWKLSLQVSGGGILYSANLDAPCSADCTQGIADSTAFSLKAVPAVNWTAMNVAWSGSCQGTSVDCALFMNADKDAQVNMACQALLVPVAIVPASWSCAAITTTASTNTTNGVEILSGEITYSAKTGISLNPGFKIGAGAIFHAVME